MNELNQLNRIAKYLEKNVSFGIEKQDDHVRIHRHRASELIDLMFENGPVFADSSIDAEIGDFLVEKLYASTVSQEVRDLALKTAQLFRKKRLDSYWVSHSNLTKITKQINQFETISKISQKLNLPTEVLIADLGLVKFIENNHLHYRIDSSYLKRGYGPIIKDGQVLFPLNTGSSFNNEAIQWVPYSSIPTDKKGKVTHAYGPYGFEPPSNTEELRPIKLQERPADVPAKIRIEMVTDAPTYDKFNISVLGHGWLRMYVPEENNGKPTNQDFVYSIGYFLRGSLLTPDLREFKPNVKLTTTQKEISTEKWLQIKTLIEDINRVLKGKKTDLPEVMEMTKRIIHGTCCNFSSTIFEQATGIAFDGRAALSRKLRFVTQPIGSLIKHFVPGIFTQWTSKLQNGYFPGPMIQLQKKEQKKAASMALRAEFC